MGLIGSCRGSACPAWRCLPCCCRRDPPLVHQTHPPPAPPHPPSPPLPSRPGFDMGAVVPVSEPEWSGAHHGLCLYASRVLQAVWDEQVRVGGCCQLGRMHGVGCACKLLCSPRQFLGRVASPLALPKQNCCHATCSPTPLSPIRPSPGGGAHARLAPALQVQAEPGCAAGTRPGSPAVFLLLCCSRRLSGLLGGIHGIQPTCSQADSPRLLASTKPHHNLLGCLLCAHTVLHPHILACSRWRTSCERWMPSWATMCRWGPSAAGQFGLLPAIRCVSRLVIGLLNCLLQLLATCLEYLPTV